MIKKIFSYFKKEDSKKTSTFTWNKIFKIQKKDRRILFSNYLPWSFYITKNIVLSEEYSLELCVVVQKRGALQISYCFRGHDLESFSADYINGVFEFFNDQVKRLGDGWMLSIEAQRHELKGYPEGTFDNVAALLVDQERKEEYNVDGKHFSSSYYLTFVYKPESEIKKKAIQFFYKEEAHQNIIENDILIFTERVQTITGILSDRLIIRPLTTQESVSYLHSTISMKRQDFLLPKNSFLFFDSFISDEVLEIGKTCKLGEHYIPIASIFDFPMETYPAIFNHLNTLNFSYRMVIRFFPLSKEQSLSELRNYQKSKAAGTKSAGQYLTEVALNTETTLVNTSAQQEQGDVEQAMAEVGSDANGLGYYQASIMVSDVDYHKAQQKLQEILKQIGIVGFVAKEEIFNAFDAFLGMTGGNTTGNIRRPLVSSGNFCHTLPFSAVWAGLSYNQFTEQLTGVSSPLVICSTHYRSLFYFNLNEGDVGHTLIIGPTGAGKSTLLNLIAIQALKYPDVQIYIMDYGLSALTLTLAVGGTYIDPLKSKVCFQPFRDIDDAQEFIWAVDFVKTIFEINGVKDSGALSTAIEDGMRALLPMEVEHRTFTGLKLNIVCEGKQDIIDSVLVPYTKEGRYGDIFDSDSSTLDNSRWVLFEMEGIMQMGQAASAPALLYIFHHLEKNFSGRLTFFIMDECWFGLDHVAVRSKMKNYLLTLRKKNVFCIFATQNPAAIAESEIASTMKQSCPTQIFLADKKAHTNEAVYCALGLEKEEVNLLASAPRFNYYFKNPSGTRLFLLTLGAVQLALFRGYNTKFKKGDEIHEWKKFLDFLLTKREKDNRSYVLEILKAQNIEYAQYLEGIDYKNYL